MSDADPSPTPSDEAAERIALAVAAGAAADPAHRAAAVALVSADDVTSVVHGIGVTPRADGGAHPRSVDDVLASGIGVSPGVGVGLVCHTANEALDAWDAGDEVVLFVSETHPADEPAMRVAAAIVTRRGGPASHAAIVARDLGVPAVCGVGDVAIDGGRQVIVDGSAGTVRPADAGSASASVEGRVRERGDADTAPAELPSALVTLLSWADEVAAGRLRVFANADRADAAGRARRFGAQGIGLCRIEHVFMGRNARLVAEVLSGSDATLVELEQLLADELVGVLEVMDGLPVTVRLLDAPAHEFGGPEEHDPMLGLRGVRLGLTRPALVEAQVRAVCRAVRSRRDVGGDPRVRLMVPLVSHPLELAHTVDLVADTVAGAGGEPLEVGVMIETPRAALVAGAIAEHAAFMSFGTNDLTQLTWGWGRDDLDARLVPAYTLLGILDRSPFTTLDVEGVGRLIAGAVAGARRVRPAMPMSLCGEHGGDPSSIAAAFVLGVETVSCSPFRVPTARLAAAHAVQAAGSGPT